MKKNFLLGSIVAVSMMALVGCGGGTNDDPNQTPFNVVKYKSIKADSNISKAIESDSLGKAMKKDEDYVSSPSDIVCEQGGVIKIDGDSVIATSCKKAEVELKGSAIYQTTDDSNKYTVHFEATADISLKDSDNTLKLDKSSYIDMNMTRHNDGNSTAVLDFDVSGSLNDILFSFDVKMNRDAYDCDNGGCVSKVIYSIAEADIKLGDYSFRLDTEHNNTVVSTAAFMEEKVLNGSIQWQENGNDVQIVFKDNNASLKVDENRDGNFADTEITDL